MSLFKRIKNGLEKRKAAKREERLKLMRTVRCPGHTYRGKSLADAYIHARSYSDKHNTSCFTYHVRSDGFEDVHTCWRNGKKTCGPGVDR